MSIKWCIIFPTWSMQYYNWKVNLLCIGCSKPYLSLYLQYHYKISHKVDKPPCSNSGSLTTDRNSIILMYNWMTRLLFLPVVSPLLYKFQLNSINGPKTNQYRIKHEVGISTCTYVSSGQHISHYHYYAKNFDIRKMMIVINQLSSAYSIYNIIIFLFS